MLEFFRDEQNKAYATVPLGSHRETYPIKSPEFWFWIARTLRQHTKILPDKSLIEMIRDEFEMWAWIDGPMHKVSVRVAEHGGATYLDLVNDEWQQVKITEDGWQVVNESPAKFRRDSAMTALPHPIGGGDPREVLRFLNLRSQSEEILVLAWLTYTLYRARGPFVNLVLIGPKDSAKSTISEVAAGLIDPSSTQLTDLPHDKRSLVMYASNRRLLPFDNLSEITPGMADALCRINTGGAHRERRYKTNDGRENVFVYQNPMILNGIGELLERPDLMDRSMLMHTQSIADDSRIPPDEFKPAFEAARPRLLGALLDVVCAGVRQVPNVHPRSLPRMADFYKWGIAVEQSLGYAPGTFVAAYRSNLADMNASAMESSPVAWVVCPFLMEQPDRIFRGTAMELLQSLTEYVAMREGLRGSQALARKHPQWPKSASAMSAELRRIESNMLKIGIEVTRWRTKAVRYIQLEMAPMTVGDAVSHETVTAQTTPPQEVAAG
jgi:hypothetical protein